MKILAIRIKNLASLDGETVLDFRIEPLKSAGIFAITGPTGAGKSTILDALCLALYAKTPRFEKAYEKGISIMDISGYEISQSEVKGILRDGTGDGYAEVDFVGIDDQYYRARWSVNRAHGKADGKLQSDSIQLLNININIPINGHKLDILKEIERLVGLNFEQFTRSVLLAQGEFTAFLKAGNDEKSALLEKLTGTQIYSDISVRVQQRQSDEKNKLALLQAQKGTINLLTAEEIANFQEELDTIEQSIADLELQLSALNKDVEWFDQLEALEKNLNLASAEKLQAEESKNASLEKELKLKKVEQVQKTRDWMKALSAAREMHQSKTDELALLNEKLKQILTKKKELESKLDLAKAERDDKVKIKNDAIPLLYRAKELDLLIQERTGLKSEHLTAYSKAKDLVERETIELDSKKSVLKIHNDRILELENWQKEREGKKQIAENKTAIVLKLNQAEQKLKDLNRALLLIAAAEKEINESQEAKNKFELEADILRSNINKATADYQAIQKEISLIPIEKLELKKNEFIEKTAAIVQGQNAWMLLYKSKKELTTDKIKHEQYKLTLSETKKSLEKSNLDLAEARTAKETSEKILNRSRLLAAEHVESLRAGLKADEDCPVCGSKEHPYVIHNPLEKILMSAMETAFNAAESELEKQLGENSRLKNSIESIQTQIEEKNTAIANKTADYNKYLEKWGSIDIHKDCENISDELKVDFLDKMLVSAKEKQQQIQLEIDSCKQKKQAADILKNSLDELNRIMTDLSANIAKEIADIQLSKLAVENQQGQKMAAENEMSATEMELNAYFTGNSWFENWKKDPEGFLKNVEDFAVNWLASTVELADESRKKELIENLLKEKEIQFGNLNSNLAQKHTKLTEISEQLTALSSERNLIFEAKAVELVSKELDEAEKLAALKYEAISNELNENALLENSAQEQKRQCLGDIEKYNLNVTENKDALEKWLNQFNIEQHENLDLTQLAKLLSYSQDWISAEQKALNDLVNKLNLTKALVNERQSNLEIHKQKKTSDKSAEEIRSSINIAKTAHQNGLERKYKIIAELKSNIEKLRNLGQLLTEIQTQEKTFDNWNKLYTLIGSLDGKKFRNIAQEYTLDVLLSCANEHLNALTKRFKIQRIPNSLGLQVLDLDMGDDIRTVYSLSGGESFLVSLALALGLSSLSSNRVKVESLFIDEGFGSLDPITLNVVMDALYSLHNMGRKVGVISHVQEMTDSIPVRIQVNKMSNGRSRVEVIG